MMERWTEKMIQNIAAAYPMDCTQKELLSFGIQSFAEISLNLAASLIIICSLHMFWEGIFFFGIFIPVRMYSGGYHSETYLRCFLFSIITLTGILLLCRSLYLPEGCYVLCVTILALAIWRESPAINPHRPVSRRECQTFLKRLAVILISVELLTIVLELFRQRRYLNIEVLSLTLILVTLFWGKIKFL